MPRHPPLRSAGPRPTSTLSVPFASPRPPVRLLTDLRQIKVVANPLRLRILGVMGQAPHTTKQVAERLGEKPTRLYNHVRALEQVGLVRLVRTQRKRGTVERYYEAVGTRFGVAESLLAGDQRARGKVVDAAVMVLLASASRAVFDAIHRRAPGGAGPRPMVARAVFTGPPERLREIQREILRWVQSFERRCKGRGRKRGAADHSWALTIAFHPVTER